MTRVLHPIAGGLAFSLIVVFFSATLISELFGSVEMVTAVKTAIPWGFLVLIPAMAGVGGTGLARAKGRRGGLLGKKARRMRWIALNGFLVLVPSALFLADRARDGLFDTAFYAVQGVELVAGATNIILIGLSIREGLRLSGRLRPRRTTGRA